MKNLSGRALLSVSCLCAIGITPSLAQETVNTIERPWLTEAEFRADETLHARPGQIVMLDLEPVESKRRNAERGPGTKSGPDASRRRLNSVNFLIERARTVSFCIPADEPHVRRIKLKRNPGRTLLNTKRGGRCEKVRLEPGSYRLEMIHSAASVGESGVKAFLHTPQPVSVTATSKLYFTQPAMDFWVMRKLTNGRIVTNNTADHNVLSPSAQAVSLSEVWRVQALEDSVKYKLVNASDGNPVQFCTEAGASGSAPWYFFTGDGTDACGIGGGADTATFKQSTFQLSLGQFTWWFEYSAPGDLLGGPVTSDASNALNWEGQNDPNNTFVSEYLGYDCATACTDDTTLPLAAGQIALYKACNYQGPAYVFIANTNDMSIYNEAALKDLGIADGEARSLRLGENTIAKLYARANQSGTPLVTAADIPCLDATAFGNDKLASFELIDESAVEYIVSSTGCRDCILTGTELSNQDFSGYDFTGSVFIGANLSGTDFSGAKLDAAELSSYSASAPVTEMADTLFDQTQLNCASFAGSDVSSASFEGISITTDFSCRLDLQGSKIAYGNFDTSDWRYFDLSHSDVSDLPDALSTVGSALDLSGSMLNSVQWLAGKTLDAVNLGCYPSEAEQTEVCADPTGNRQCSTLQGINLVKTSLRGACMESASLESSFLSLSNLDGASLEGAQLKSIEGGNPVNLSGAFMRNVTLSGADLTGVNASGISFYSAGNGQADAEGVNAPNADFSNAYLALANFSGETTNLQSTNWAGAMLLKLNFDQADLSTNTEGDVISGTNTKFTGAHMWGVSMNQTNLENVNFTSTYWDTLGEGGKRTFLIPKQNLTFSGYWKDTDLPECPPALAWDSGTPPPMNVTTSENTCPNGGPGPCDQLWDQPAQDIAQAFFPTAVSPAYPQDSSAPADEQCGTASNPADLCWIIDNNPALCPENVSE